MVTFITLRTSPSDRPIKDVTVNLARISWMQATGYGHVVLHMVDGESIKTTVTVEKLGNALGRSADVQLVNVF